jgi:hypothetical protein
MCDFVGQTSAPEKLDGNPVNQAGRSVRHRWSFGGFLVYKMYLNEKELKNYMKESMKLVR